MEKCKYDDEDLKNLARATAEIFSQEDYSQKYGSYYYKHLSARDQFMQELKSFAAERNEATAKQDNFVYYIVCDSNDTITYDASPYIYADLPYFHSYEDAIKAVRYFGERDFYNYYFDWSE